MAGENCPYDAAPTHVDHDPAKPAIEGGSKQIFGARGATMNEQSGEYWRRKGYELVMRYGSVRERMQAQSRLCELEKIWEQTRYFFEARRSQEAA